MMTSGLIRHKGDSSPHLLAAAADPRLTADVCDMEYWLKDVCQGMLAGLTFGHSRSAVVPRWMLESGPLRSALLEEFAFRHVAEEMATRAITYMVRSAPTLATMDFYSTQLLDEARHAAVFRGHLVELGLPRETIAQEIDRIVGAARERVLAPIESFGLEIGRSGDFLAQVVVLTVVAEGVLAPASEMSEHKWRVFDPPAAEISLGVVIDETRHLAVGSSVIREHLLAHPGDAGRLQAMVERGLRLVESLPMQEVLVRREALFQQGIEQYRDRLGGCELVPGVPLAQTCGEERLAIQESWSREMQMRRLEYMGLQPI